MGVIIITSNLLHPKKVEDVKFADLVKVLNEHFTPRRSTFADRAKFYEATIKTCESLEDWAARLRGLAVYCDFGTALDILLRDRFVLGLKSGPERDRLFEKDSSTLTLAQALEVAQQAACARAARANVAQAEPVQVKEEPVFRASAGRAGGARATSGNGGGDDGASLCSVCGRKNHDTAKCRFKGYRCQSCGQKGHLKKVCAKRGSGGKSRLHCIQTESDDSDGCKECEVFNARRYVDNYKPIKLPVTLSDVQILMELESGSGASVISDELYSKFFKKRKLYKTDLSMCLYNGHKILPLGYFRGRVCYMSTVKHLKIYVVQNGGPPLLGRDFMAKFKIRLVCDNNKLTPEPHIDELPQLLNDFPDVWKDELGRFNKFEVDLFLKQNSVPKFFKPRSIPFALKGKVEEELDRLVKVGILVPVNFSDYATPIVPVLKSNGKLKIAGDYSCTLNKDLKIDKYPLPRIEEVLAKIGGGEHYSKLDLSNAYNQLCLSESSQILTTINTPKGLFKYTRLLYGLANAPAIFQRTMETLLAGIEGVTCWLDDVCCTGPDRATHLARLREVLKRLQDAGLRLQRDKCAFFQTSITYLGYVIDKNGLRTSQDKVSAILKSPPPKNVYEVQQFLGVVNYYRKFIPNASSLLHPLHELLRNGAKWQWGERQQAAFDNVRRELASDRVLAHFNPEAPLVLTTDAGPSGLGAVLAHLAPDGSERPIAFASRSLLQSEKNYSQIFKEATAIIFAVKYFHQYLYGRQDPFILKTDHRPLLSIFGKKNGISVTTASRLQRYAIILSAYNYNVQYINTKNNQVADYFSRAPLQITTREVVDREQDNNVSFLNFLDGNIKPVSFDDIKKATAADDVLMTVSKYMRSGWPRKIDCSAIKPYFLCKSDLEWHNGCLFRGHRIVIPAVFRDRMLEELHSAHFGVVKTKSAARSRFWWPGIDGDIERWVGACSVCAVQRAAPPRAAPAAWPRPATAWERIHIDYLSIGQKVYLVVIDAFSKWLECVNMDCGTSTNALISKLKYIFSRYGLPCTIVSDNDVKICSSEFNAFCKNNGILYLTSPIYHPSSNGQAENSVKSCKK
ncbi:uncharacterized protein K02A2.6-like [Cydia amplana]|uniref:uncharacterized protein K02A2.6-like n=1 Tax=Cydia amplana TaxID=1869771 RepID=UPI002FE58848